MVLILLFIFGLVVGSFLNVLIYRLWEGEEIVKTPSHCRSCGKQLRWHELVPVLSYIWLGGKCANCKAPISVQYPLVELATGLLFVLVAFKFGVSSIVIESSSHWLLSLLVIKSLSNWLLILGHFALISLLIVLFVFDLRHYLLPNSILYLTVGLATVIALLQPQFADRALGAAVAAGFIALLVVLTREKGMGAGDAWLAFPLGMLVGWPLVLIGIFLSFLLGSLVGGLLMVFGKKTLKSQVPFGPFLISGFLIVFFVGQRILDWYFSVFSI